jgi:nitroreductase
MEVMEAIYRRRAVRSFTAAPVARSALTQLIDAAVHAPSAVNEQPWLFTVIEGRALLDEISTKAKAHFLGTSAAGLMSHHFTDTLGNREFDIFYSAPALILISAVKDGPWAVANCALAAENLMLAARSLELGTCWIGFAQGWLGTPEGKSAINLPADCLPVAPIIVGHPAADPPAVPRRPPEIRWLSR